MTKKDFLFKGMLLVCLIGYPLKSLAGARPFAQEIFPEIPESFLRDGFFGGIVILILMAIVLTVCGIFALPKAIRDGWSGIKWMLFDATFSVVIMMFLGVSLVAIFIDKDAGLVFVPLWLAGLLLVCATPLVYGGILFLLGGFAFFTWPIRFFLEVPSKIGDYVSALKKK